MMTNKRVTANGFMPSAAGFEVPSRHLIIGGTLFGIGSALCFAGIAVSGAGLASAAQRWIAGLERAPADIAKDAFSAARAAAIAGAHAWQEENAALHAQHSQHARV
jgi:hypothetical protein